MHPVSKAVSVLSHPFTMIYMYTSTVKLIFVLYFLVPIIMWDF